MAHSDDSGLILPPRIAPLQVVIVPIYKGEEKKQELDAKGQQLVKNLKAAGISVKFDDNDNSRPGFKFAEYEMKGVPVRIAMGLRDLENNSVEIARRDTKEKKTVSLDGLTEYIKTLLEDIQTSMYQKAKAYRDSHITKADTMAEFERLLDEKGGFVLAHWDGTNETEDAIKERTKATIRCIPLDNPEEPGKCILTGQPSTQRVLFARAY
ncbi:proline--tRNA ligase anticodon binding domain-containing protein [Puia sp. P3]|uniref:proline--tRNA ligase anticodon binding domain-containing protein n=1 Tax=Puia sp. P3 TaxID=3423952 RepID=UPI003D6646F2